MGVVPEFQQLHLLQGDAQQPDVLRHRHVVGPFGGLGAAAVAVSTAAGGLLQGVGKPEPLRENLSGCWSRRIDVTHRLVFRVEGSVYPADRGADAAAALRQRLRRLLTPLVHA
jgi:hypothetical protein